MTSPQRRSTWIWFYAVLGLLAVAAIVVPLVTIPLVHGLEPVTLERLQLARQMWDRAGPRDYDMEYRKQGSLTGTFAVQVRNGRAVSVLMDGQALPARELPYHTMPVMFDDLERLLELAQKPAAAGTILRARFDPKDGRLVRYIYSYTTGTSRMQIEVSVKLRPARAAAP
jgi:hypothetical protein